MAEILTLNPRKSDIKQGHEQRNNRLKPTEKYDNKLIIGRSSINSDIKKVIKLKGDVQELPNIKNEKPKYNFDWIDLSKTNIEGINSLKDNLNNEIKKLETHRQVSNVVSFDEKKNPELLTLLKNQVSAIEFFETQKQGKETWLHALRRAVFSRNPKLFQSTENLIIKNLDRYKDQFSQYKGKQEECILQGWLNIFCNNKILAYIDINDDKFLDSFSDQYTILFDHVSCKNINNSFSDQYTILFDNVSYKI